MATAEPISMLLCIVWVRNDHNLPQNQSGQKRLFRVSYLLLKVDGSFHLVKVAVQFERCLQRVFWKAALFAFYNQNPEIALS